MVRIITKDEIKQDPRIIEEMKKGIFIYPTDTIYGIGCDATNPALVEKIRKLKKSKDQPFSIIVPNKNMIFESCETNESMHEWTDKLPGPYTLIFKVKKKFFADNVAPGANNIGIRIPNNWFYNVVKKMKVPVITTSANITGEAFMTSVDDLEPSIRHHVDFIIDDGVINGKPSTLVRLDKDSLEIKER